ncbi:DUF1631 domain-containing protein [Pseudomonas sp. MPB23]|uniref:DUF1631 domain-containing protein n=1 Tax=Pseudomonas sp. MPB23 TaxID=3388490 RepID=UPI00398466A2
MHNDGKVVPINQAHTTPSPLARLPVVLLQVRDKAAQQLQQGLQELFDNADDTLFEMADKARNTIDHHIFFEAMRDLRLKRKNFERVFMAQLFEAFADLSHAGQGELQLVPVVSYDLEAGASRDALEKAVALKVMVDRVHHRDGLALGQLTTRLSALLGNRLNDWENPLGPALLCEFFLRAGRSLGVEIRVKLIMLKLFEKYVLSDADQLYGGANQLLVATGVLPGLKAVPSRRPAAREACGEALLSAVDQPVGENGQEAFTTLQALLVTVRGSVAPILEACAEPQPIATRDLLRLLSHLQQYVPEPEVEDDFDLRNQLEQLLTRVSVKSGKSRVVEDADEDVINLIALLFEFILNDRSVPDAFKALIARLQIPMLKVAVLDKSFFSRASHPARRLLNEIAAAVIGWSPQHDYPRDNLYVRIEQVVQRLLNEFVEDPAIFSQLLAQFGEFTANERRRSELLEQHTRNAEEGRVSTEAARQRVAEVLNRCLPDNDPDLLNVRQLRIGSWVVFQQDQANSLRCKLAAIIEPANRFIFVSRTGLKVLEKSTGQLALAFKHGALHTLDDGPLFERALAAVTGKLRQLNRGK